MFKRLPAHLPADPSFPPPIPSPARRTFHISDNPRVNATHHDACARAVDADLVTRLAALGIVQRFCTGPQGRELVAQAPPPPTPFLPIFLSDPAVLRRAERVVVVVGESSNEPAIWSWRVMAEGDEEAGLVAGTALGLVHRLRARPDPPALVILNSAQLLYSPTHHRACTHRAWLALPKPHVLAPVPHIHPTHNRIPGHADLPAHLATALNHLLPPLLLPSARLDVVALADAADALALHLDALQRFHRLALIAPQHAPADLSASVRARLARDARAWIVSDRTRGEVIAGPWDPDRDGDGNTNGDGSANANADANGLAADLDPYDDAAVPRSCTTLSSGVADAVEMVWPRVLPDVLEWLLDG